MDRLEDVFGLMVWSQRSSDSLVAAFKIPATVMNQFMFFNGM